MAANNGSRLELRSDSAQKGISDLDDSQLSRHKIVQWVLDFPFGFLRRGLGGGSRIPRGIPGICERA